MTQQQGLPEQELESHIIEEFIAEYNESHSDIETLLLKLENNPEEKNLLNELFRKVHTIKGNAQLIGLELISGFVHALENILDRLRKHELSLDKSLSDTILRCVDHIGTLCSDILNQRSGDNELTHNIQNELNQLAIAGQPKIDQCCQRIHLLFDSGGTLPLVNDTDRLCASAKVNLVSQQLEDLKFFAQIIESAEQRSPFWTGRTQRILNIALEMNTEAGQKVDNAQLEAAVYLHDFGMAFLPLEILHKGNSLTEEEYRSVQLHTRMGAALLGDNPHWQSAADMVIQHHEREDGQGYPNQLIGNQICDGAKILAIADSFEAMTNQRANRSDRIPVSQALREISHNSGSQFSPFWVDIFLNVIRKMTRKNLS
ncbi:HD domain-containing phosphohydrolase [Kaarinaea lacus]